MKNNTNAVSNKKRINASIESCDVLYIAECSEWGELGYRTVASAFSSVFPVFWSPGVEKPDIQNWQGDWIISFKSDLLLPAQLLKRAKKGAINIHPCPPKYRGLGGYWWALYNRDETFGVTCHHMDEQIDHGEIIRTKEFAIWKDDTEQSLKHRAAIYSLGLLANTIDDILVDKPLLSCGKKWGSHLYTEKELVQTKAQLALDAVSLICSHDGTQEREDRSSAA